VIDRLARTLGIEPFFMQLISVWQDDRACVQAVVGYLAEQGHRRIARVGGSSSYWHSVLRREAFESVAAAAGLSALSVAADYTAEHGAEATVGLLGSAEPPTAILYDSDVMAAAGLGVPQRMGLSVPGGVSIVSWDDSALCELMHPALTALRRDIAAAGSVAARMLRELTAGGHPESLAEPASALQVRMSSGPVGVPVLPVPVSVSSVANGTPVAEETVQTTPNGPVASALPTPDGRRTEPYRAGGQT
jgi:DNA-binding LacI/PurR family transcriptional regulator